MNRSAASSSPSPGPLIVPAATGTGHFQGRRRDATATGTVVVNGETLVDGTTDNAEIETLEDTNTSRPG